MARKKRPYCLSIGGFDPSGGAGVLADLKVFEQLNIHGLGVLTANTFQTEDAYFGESWIETEDITLQINQLLERYSVQYIKIGLTKDVEQLNTILTTIRLKNPNAFILWDPILKPSAANKHDENRYTSSIEELLKKIDWITPNKQEATLLFGIQQLPSLATASQCSVYLKGGHNTEEALGKDLLFHKNGKLYPFNPKQISIYGKHGSGCVLSAAQLGYFTLDFPLIKTCLKSKRLMEHYLNSSPTLLGLHKK